jgi:hypothetical protein
LITLFVFVLFTLKEFKNIQISLDDKSTSEINYEIAREEIKRLNNIESKLNSSEFDVSKYINEVKEDDIIDYIYSWIDDDNMENSTG